MTNQIFTPNYDGDDSVWTVNGLTVVGWFTENGSKIPLLFVESGEVAALKPSSLRWHNGSVFATFVADGRKFEINTRFYGERRELMQFCIKLLEKRSGKTSKRAKAQKTTVALKAA